MRHIYNILEELITLRDYMNDKPFTVAGTASTKILLFDVDDTLIKSNAQTAVYKDGKLVTKLTPQQFNTYKLKPGETFDFSDFDNADILDSSIFTKYWGTLKREYRKGTHIGILTARGNPDIIRDHFIKHGIDIKPGLCIAINNRQLPYTGSVQQRKSQAIQDLAKLGYKTFVFFDDDEGNLKLAKKQEESCDIKVITVKV